VTINSALLAGVTGLTANASALAAISENIANANTIGYKRVGVNFADLVNADAGSSYSAGGLTASIHNMISQQGTITSSGSATDLAIAGGGFFVTSASPNGAVTDGLLFTRAGSFNIDKDGYLQNASGLYLQGWPTDSSGTVLSGSGADSLAAINLLQFANSAQATSKTSISANLNSDQAISASEGSWAGGKMADFASGVAGGIAPDFSIQMPINDSKGGTRNVVLDFLKGANPNEWHVEVRADPKGDIQGSANGLITSGLVKFNSDGSLASSTLTSIGVAASGGAAPAWATALGVDPTTINLDLSGLTQLSGASSTNKVSSDGTPFGSLSGVSVDAAGDVTAIFANGSTRKIAQLALATFTNPDGLSPISGGAFGQTAKSGAFSLKAAGTGGAGSISPSSLEASTVDLSTEFTGLITTQRAYSASSKIITTADQMLEQLLAIKQ
jgi:flagellar hook protein FlgE